MKGSRNKITCARCEGARYNPDGPPMAVCSECCGLGYVWVGEVGAKLADYLAQAKSAHDLADRLRAHAQSCSQVELLLRRNDLTDYADMMSVEAVATQTIASALVDVLTRNPVPRWARTVPSTPSTPRRLNLAQRFFRWWGWR